MVHPPALFTKMSGVINCTAPNPVRLSEMCDHLGNVMGRPSWLPVPDFALKAVLGEGASVVGVFPTLFLLLFPSSVFSATRFIRRRIQLDSLQVLEGQRVLPAKAKELGFPFKYPYVKDALKSILSQD